MGVFRIYSMHSSPFKCGGREGSITCLQLGYVLIQVIYSISFKEFDPSYTIPRRKNDCEQGEDQLKSILADAYEAPVDTSPRLQSANSTAVGSWETVSQSSPDPSTNPLKRTWSDANSTPANKVCKSNLTIVFPPFHNVILDKDTFNELYDLSLPGELLLLFQPLFCKLCMFQLSGNSMAKLHYQSKNHDKKVRTWLISYSERTGQPLHKRATMPRLKKGDAVSKIIFSELFDHF